MATRKKRPRGRPTKLSKAVQEKICSAIRAGNYIEVAAAYAGINKDTLYAWLKKGARSKRRSPHKDFSDAVEKALADAEVRDVALIGEAAKAQWQAAAWRLERKAPKRWGRKQAIEIGGGEAGDAAPKLPEIQIRLVQAEPYQGQRHVPRITYIPQPGEQEVPGGNGAEPHRNGDGGDEPKA